MGLPTSSLLLHPERDRVLQRRLRKGQTGLPTSSLLLHPERDRVLQRRLWKGQTGSPTSSLLLHLERDRALQRRLLRGRTDLPTSRRLPLSLLRDRALQRRPWRGPILPRQGKTVRLLETSRPQPSLGLMTPLARRLHLLLRALWTSSDTSAPLLHLMMHLMMHQTMHHVHRRIQKPAPHLAARRALPTFKAQRAPLRKCRGLRPSRALALRRRLSRALALRRRLSRALAPLHQGVPMRRLEISLQPSLPMGPSPPLLLWLLLRAPSTTLETSTRLARPPL